MMKKVLSILLAMSLVAGLMIVTSSCSNSESVKVLEVGVKYQGGIVAYIGPDGKSGLIVSAKEIGANVDWESAIKLCDEYETDEYNDWYLPTKQELSLIFDNSDVARSFPEESSLLNYWSSTEVSEDKAVYMTYGHENSTLKADYIGLYVRAVRKFNNN